MAKSTEAKQAIRRAAEETGIPFRTLYTIASIESSLKPDAQRAGSRYKGLFQLTDNDFGGEDIFNPYQNAKAAGTIFAHRISEFKRRYGRTPSVTDLYMMHQQGEGGWAEHTMRPDRAAWRNMLATGEGQGRIRRHGRESAVQWAKSAVWGNIPASSKKRFSGVGDVTSRDLFQTWQTRIESIQGRAPNKPRMPATPEPRIGGLSTLGEEPPPTPERRPIRNIDDFERFAGRGAPPPTPERRQQPPGLPEKRIDDLSVLPSALAMDDTELRSRLSVDAPSEAAQRDLPDLEMVDVDQIEDVPMPEQKPMTITDMPRSASQPQRAAPKEQQEPQRVRQIFGSPVDQIYARGTPRWVRDLFGDSQ